MKSAFTFKSKGTERKTDVFLGLDLLSHPKFLNTCQNLGKQLAIITDEHVASLYGHSLHAFLQENECDCRLIPFKGGEKRKNRKTKEVIEDQLLQEGFGPQSFLIALGGGVVTDLTGFIASTYYQGIPYLSVPTSLVGMIDASIENKIGINVGEKKDVIGSIYVFIDLSTLSTLPEAEMLTGTAKMIQYGLTSQHSLFEKFVDETESWQQRDLKFFQEVIYESCHIKAKIIENEERKVITNFGQTIACAMQTIDEEIFPALAAAIGMITESLISSKLGNLKEKEFLAITHLFRSMHFPLMLPPQMTMERMLQILTPIPEGGASCFTTLDGIGKVHHSCQRVENSLLKEVIGYMIAEFSEK
jgi:3-dehydroquinate synthase